jgi:hypothetical protein
MTASEPPPNFASSGFPTQELWDEEEAEWLIGKYALVGVTIVRHDGESQGQYHGRIVSADRQVGITIDCEGVWKGRTLVLPPATGWFDPADPGEYRLRATGEIITDPDVLSRWSIEPNKAG